MTDTPPQSPADSPAASPTPELTAPERPIEAPPPPKPRNPVRRLTLIVMSVGIAIFAYTLLSDRLTPYTAQATIQAYLVRILPEVSGKIVELAVTDNQIVEAGSLLFRIDPAQYAIAAERATAQLEAAGQSVGASTAGLGAAEANLARAIAERMRGNRAASHALNDQSLDINHAMQGAAAELTSMWPRISSAFLALQRQQLDEAERRFRRVADFLSDQDLYRSYRNSAQIGLGLVTLARGDLPAAQTQLQGALADPVNLYPYIYVQALLGLATIAYQQDDQILCRQTLQRALAYAGQRSLLEEYVETVLMMVNLQPADAPVHDLLQAILAYVAPLALAPAMRALRAALTGA